MPRIRAKKGALVSAPFLLLLLAGAALAAGPCPSDRHDAEVRVAHVYDGDTVRLSDGRKVRFIGINTPEIGRDGEPSQPYAESARRVLKALLAGQGSGLLLRHGRERHDRYGRLLAHPYLPDGTSINAVLLERGLATTLTVPPNLWNRGCYRAVEADARQARRGVWSHPDYRPVESRALSGTDHGYRLLTGRVERIGQSRKSTWLNLEGAAAVRIPRGDLAYFDDIQALAGKRILARGWLRHSRGRWMMTVRHPADLQVEE